MAYHRFKRLNITLISIVLVFILYTVFFSSSSQFSNQLSSPNPISEKNLPVHQDPKDETKLQHAQEKTELVDKKPTKQDKTNLIADYDLSDANLAFMPKMTNETLKAELGNAAWKLFHTILARYPVKPTQDQQSHLSNYIQYFAKVYPCGDCARHFQKLLEKYPPQLTSRSNAAVWGCHIHNKVNERLKKPIYDCSHIIDDYDCGCGEDEELEDFTLNGASIKSTELSDHLLKIELDEKEGLQLGG